MDLPEFAGAQWRKAKRSQTKTDSCVEVASEAIWRKVARSQTGGDACADVAAGLDWQKAGRSEPTRQCVEVVHVARYVAVRDSKHPASDHLIFDAAEWRSFVAEVKAGRLG